MLSRCLSCPPSAITFLIEIRVADVGAGKRRYFAYYSTGTSTHFSVARSKSGSQTGEMPVVSIRDKTEKSTIFIKAMIERINEEADFIGSFVAIAWHGFSCRLVKGDITALKANYSM